MKERFWDENEEKNKTEFCLKHCDKFNKKYACKVNDIYLSKPLFKCSVSKSFISFSISRRFFLSALFSFVNSLLMKKESFELFQETSKLLFSSTTFNIFNQQSNSERTQHKNGHSNFIFNKNMAWKITLKIWSILPELQMITVHFLKI